MKILPILFNTEMVKAILEGRKTVTRRVLKLPFEIHPNGFITKPKGDERLCPYEPPYEVGDVLYIRETWSEWTGGYLYKAWTEPFLQPGQASVMKWHPSLYMPKEAARIWLKVTDVRVERLQDMSEVDTAKEGIETDVQTHKLDDQDFIENFGGIELFKKLWNSTIKKSDLDRYGWDANPYVWVIEFERCEKQGD